MESRLTVPALNTDSGRRPLLILTILSVMAGWLSLAPAYANWQSFKEWVFGTPAVSQPANNVATNQPAGATTAPVVVPEPKRPEPVPETDSYVGGVWRSGSGHVFFLEPTSVSSFDVYMESDQHEQVRIGAGRVTSAGITATVKTLAERRLAEITLKFSDDHKTLSGTFSGTARQEKNFTLVLRKEE
jgi:hypothetical protein